MDVFASEINLEKFLPFLEAVAETDCSLTLFDETGRLRKNSHSGQQKDADALLQVFVNHSFDWSAVSGNNHFTALPQGCVLMLEKLRLGAAQEKFWLAIVMAAADAKLISEKKQRLARVLHTIAACVTEDYITNLSLSGMAEELGVRYEELNLLYGLESDYDYLANKNEHDALNQLLNNSTDYLNVALVALFVVEEDRVIHYVGLNHEDIDSSLILEELRDPLLHWMKTSHETLMINRETDSVWTLLNHNRPFKMIATPLLKASGKLAGILLMLNSPKAQDFTNSDRKLAEVLAAEAAKLIRERRDKLTELLNRKGFYEKMQSAVDQVKISGKEYWLVFLDLDRFKSVNDASGQEAGNKLLIQIGALIKKQLAPTDMIARLGADEFAVLLDGYSFAEAQKTVEKIRLIIQQFRFVFANKRHDAAVSIGVVWVDPTAETISELLSAADLACRIAKEKGGNRIHVYQASDQELLAHEDHMQWIGRINKALEEQRFVLYRQRILCLDNTSNNKEHYELLIRLKDENGTIISPIQFIPAAERYGLMSKLDRWVIKTALAKIARVYAQKPEISLCCSINLSGQSFCEQGFLEYLIDQVHSSGIPTQSICLEMTETAAVANLSQAIDFMQAVKGIGCKFSLDDFGSGMSSFTYLKNLPVDYLKIDGYFVKTILENKIDRTMVESINQIGQVMGLKTIAEFAENDAILVELKKIGVNYAQGYGIGKPEPFDPE